MTLWEGVFGKLFGGVDESLKFQPHILSCHIRSSQRGCIYSSTLRAVVRAAVAHYENSLMELKAFLVQIMVFYYRA